MSLSGPAATTGPVGAPVGEPPGGSLLTASVVPGPMRAASSRGSGTRACGPSGSTPSETGGLLPSITQSSSDAAGRGGAGGAVDAEDRGLGLQDGEERHVAVDGGERGDEPRRRLAGERRARAQAANQSAATAAAAVAARQRPALLQSRARSDGGAPKSRAVIRRSRPRRRRGLGIGGVERLEVGAPGGDQRGEGRVARLARGAGGGLLGAEQAQHVLPASAASGSSGRSAGARGVGHDPRHSLRLISARRSQVRMVLSGTSKRRARSS